MLRLFNLSEVAPELPRLLARGEFGFRFEKVPYRVSGIPWRKRLNMLLAGLNQYVLPGRPLAYPVIAQVEPANVCNLACPLCSTASLVKSRPGAVMPLETFERFIEEVGDYLLLIVFWIWGEPFLSSRFLEMVRLAADRGIVTHSSTNGNVPFSRELAEAIVQSGLSSLVFGVDGATQETYERYRQGGKLERVRANITALVEAKRRLGSATPRIVFRFVAMSHNESELPLAEQMASDLGADYFAVKSVDLHPEWGENLDARYQPGEARLRRYEYEAGGWRRKQKPFYCMRPWKRITLDARGFVLSCEYDHREAHAFGRVDGEKTALRAWKGDAARAFRRAFHGGHNDFYHCATCTYKDNQSEDCILEVRPVAAPSLSGAVETSGA